MFIQLGDFLTLFGDLFFAFVQSSFFLLGILQLPVDILFLLLNAPLAPLYLRPALLDLLVEFILPLNGLFLCRKLRLALCRLCRLHSVINDLTRLVFGTSDFLRSDILVVVARQSPGHENSNDKCDQDRNNRCLHRCNLLFYCHCTKKSTTNLVYLFPMVMSSTKNA